MRLTSLLPGLFRYFLLTLQLNFRSKQAIMYGYLVPVFFLVAFGSVFRAESPPLLAHMGQILTITILGGACFGLPTALVAERERGVWRRYRLLPVATSNLVGGVLLVRLVIVISAAVLQIVLAWVVYQTPLPSHPVQALVALIFVTVSFLGLGLLVAALADDVPAVQALGQCLFLPMILIGGVGVPLAALPDWAQRVSGFMPGRYAVEILQLSFSGPRGILQAAGFSALALVVIGCAAGGVGAKLFRWDVGRHVNRTAWAWIAVALLAWLVVGLGAAVTGRLKPVLDSGAGYAAITEAQVNGITFRRLPGDNEIVTRLAPPFQDQARVGGMPEFATKLKAWAPGHVDDAGQSVRNLLCVAAVADVSEDLHEGEIARLVFNDCRTRFDDDRLRRALAWVILNPQDGIVITSAPELGFGRRFTERIIRERSAMYAEKFIGRLLGKIPD